MVPVRPKAVATSSRIKWTLYSSAERFDTLQESSRRRQHSGRPLNSRLNDHGADFAVMFLQGRFKFLQAVDLARVRLLPERAAVAIGIERFVRLEQQRLEYLVKQLHATQTHRTDGVAMVGIRETK